MCYRPVWFPSLCMHIVHFKQQTPTPSSFYWLHWGNHTGLKDDTAFLIVFCAHLELSKWQELSEAQEIQVHSIATFMGLFQTANSGHKIFQMRTSTPQRSDALVQQHPITSKNSVTTCQHDDTSFWRNQNCLRSANSLLAAHKKIANSQKPWEDKHWKRIWSAQTQQDSLEVAASAPFAARTATVELHKLF